MLISHFKKKIKRYFSPVLLLKSSFLPFFFLFIFLSDLMKDEDEMKQWHLQSSEKPVWHIAKNYFERNSPYIFSEKQIVLSVLKFYSFETECTYEQKMICIVFWNNYRAVEAEDICSLNFLDQCMLIVYCYMPNCEENNPSCKPSWDLPDWLLMASLPNNHATRLNLVLFLLMQARYSLPFWKDLGIMPQLTLYCTIPSFNNP